MTRFPSKLLLCLCACPAAFTGTQLRNRGAPAASPPQGLLVGGEAGGVSDSGRTGCVLSIGIVRDPLPTHAWADTGTRLSYIREEFVIGTRSHFRTDSLPHVRVDVRYPASDSIEVYLSGD